MKSTLFVLLLSFSMPTLKAQLTSSRWHVLGKSSGGYMDSTSFINIGASAEYIFRGGLALNYNFEYQRRGDFNHIHGSMGSIVGPLLIISGIVYDAAFNPFGFTEEFSLSRWTSVGGLLIALLPDGVSYHIPLNYHWDLAPYCNFVGVDYVWSRKWAYSEWKYAMSFGGKLTYWSSNGLTLNTFIESRKVASTKWGIGAGISVGYAFAPISDSNKVKLPRIR
ncbi:MAG: hypothetical protein RL037_648 [Bacteroidota bacterium]